VTVTGSKYFQITANSCDNPVPAGESCQVAVTFAPLDAASAGDSSGTLTITGAGIPGCAFALHLQGVAD
jgi:hypothetical protein